MFRRRSNSMVCASHRRQSGSTSASRDIGACIQHSVRGVQHRLHHCSNPRVCIQARLGSRLFRRRRDARDGDRARPHRARGGGVRHPLGRYRDGRRIRSRRRTARAHRRARRVLRCRRADDRVQQHRRAGSWPREAAPSGQDQARDLVLLHVESGGSRSGERRRDRGDARAARDVRRGHPGRRGRDRGLPHARRSRHASRGGQGGAARRRDPARARDADPRRRGARLRGTWRCARQSLVQAHGTQLQSVDGDGRTSDNRRGG